MNTIVSIIVPVYNTSKYLAACIESVMHQTYKNWELILVDDGSTDGSDKICDEFAAKDSRIKVEHKVNSGVSDTRNHGIKKAKGEWLFFLDSDDELYPCSLDSMIEWSKRCDLVVGIYNMNVTNPDYKCTGAVIKSFYNKSVSPKAFVKCLIHRQLGFTATVSPKLYKTSIIKDNHLCFNKDIYYAEDQLLLAQYLCCKETQKVYINNKKSVYKYNLRSDNATSLMVEKKLTKKTFTDFMGFYNIYETYKNRFHDNEIINWAKWNAYVSGMNIMSMMSKPYDITKEQANYLDCHLKELTNDGKDKKLINKYDYNEKFLAMKVSIKGLSKDEQVDNIHKWLNSTDCSFTYLTLGWKIIYLLSHCFGKCGIRVVIDKIKFN